MRINMVKEYIEETSLQFIPNIDKFNRASRREHCLVDPKLLYKIGLKQRQQILIKRLGIKDTPRAIYTITGIHNQEPDTVFVGYTAVKDLKERLELLDTNSFSGVLDPQITAIGLSEKEAKEYGEFIEHLNDNGNNDGLVVIAPHGGDIEKHTDDQAKSVYEEIPSGLVTRWICKGFKPGGGAFDRWHITSTDISEESFPKLKMIIHRRFKYAISFHGWKHDDICIGGSMYTDLKKQIKNAIMDVISGSDIDVKTDYEKTSPDDFNGDNSDNIVNRLSTQGLQIELSMKARKEYGTKIVHAISNVINTLINA